MKNAAHSKRLFRVFGLLIPPPLNFAEFHTRGGRGPQRGCPGMRPPLGVGTLRAGRAAAPGRKKAPAGTRPGGSAGGAAGPGKAPARHTPGRKGGGPRARAAHPSRAARARKPRGKRARFARKAAFFRASRAAGGKTPAGAGGRRGGPGKAHGAVCPGGGRGARERPRAAKTVCPGRGGAAGRGDCWTAPSGQKATHSKTKTHPAAGGQKAPAANDPGRAAGKPGAFLPI